MRIKSLELDSFRGFPLHERILLDSKNLLVYGENGAGKSSLYAALSGLFSLDQPALGELRNQFNRLGTPRVGVEFDDGQPPAVWSLAGHPARVGGDARVADAALRVACLDYRSLLRTNFVFGSDPLNWFRVLHEELLAGFRVLNGPTIRDRWLAVQRVSREEQASYLTQGLRNDLISACTDFSNQLRDAVVALRAELPVLLDELALKTLAIELPDFPTLTYSLGSPKKDRGLVGTSYTPVVTFLDLPPLPLPQAFLNEARLSQIALAIYLAARRVVVPSSVNDPKLKLLVLDDVLMGLDHVNRLPLLRVLDKFFSDWQIVLLTHDRVWFEMARYEIADTGSWKAMEIFDRSTRVCHPPLFDPVEVPCPLVHEPEDLELPLALLAKAITFLEAGHLSAAANYTRAGFEVTIKVICHRYRIRVPFSLDPAHVSTSVYLDGIKRWVHGGSLAAKENLLKRLSPHATVGSGSELEGPYATIASALEWVGFYRRIVLNPGSHGLPWTITDSEVRGAVRAVEALYALNRRARHLDSRPLGEARVLIASATPTDYEVLSALGNARAAFAGSLVRYASAMRMNWPLGVEADAGNIWVELMKDHSSRISLEGCFGSRAALGEVDRLLLKPLDPSLSVRKEHVERALSLVAVGNSEVTRLDTRWMAAYLTALGASAPSPIATPVSPGAIP